jgi:hypothetical protein
MICGFGGKIEKFTTESDKIANSPQARPIPCISCDTVLFGQKKKNQPYFSIFAAVPERASV